MHFNFINIKKRQIRNCHLAKFAVLLVSNFQMLYFCISINVKWCHLVSYWLIDVDDRILVLDSTDNSYVQGRRQGGREGSSRPRTFWESTELGEIQNRRNPRYGHYLEVSPQDFQNPIDAPDCIVSFRVWHKKLHSRYHYTNYLILPSTRSFRILYCGVPQTP